MQNESQVWMIIGIVLLNAYGFGASCVERFVNYQSWPLLAKADFSVYHRAQQPFILSFIVAPLAVSFMLQVALCFFRPVEISWAIVLALIIPSGIGALSTGLIQIPIHRKLNANGFSSDLIARLLRSDWLRKAADVVRMVATGALLWQLIRR